MSNGEYNLSVTDLSIAGKVLPVEIVRTYGSRREYNSRFGFGWDMNYNMKVRRLVDPNTIIFLDGQGYRREYTRDDSDPNLYERAEDLSDYFDYNDVSDTFTLVNKSEIKYTFDPNGNLSSITDKNGNSITFTYDSNGLLPIYGHSIFFYTEEHGGPSNKYGMVAKEYMLTAIIDDLDRSINFYYDSNGLLTDINDFDARNWHYTYDPNTNDLLTVTDANGNISTYTYHTSSNHNLLTITDANGQTYLTNSYSANDMVEWQRYGEANDIYTFVYDDANSTATITDREGFVTEMLYSSSGQVESETVYTANPDDDPNSFTTQHFFDSNNLELLRTIFPAGNCISYTYDSLANVTGIYRKTDVNDPNSGTDPNVIATTYTYDSTHIYDINSVTAPDGNTTYFDYDTNGNLEKITYPSVAVYGQSPQQPTIEYTYNSSGQVETVTAPDDIVTKFEYYSDSDPNDPNCGKLWKVIADYNTVDGLNLTTEYKYDTAGNIREVEDPNNNVTKFTYNAIDLLTKTESPLNYITNNSYNKNQKLSQIERVRSSDPNQITSFSYDVLDHLQTITNPLSYVTNYGYNKNEDPNIVTDAEDNSTISVYNERGLLIQVTDANNNVTKYTYTANGAINDVNDAKGNVTSYEYDGFGRLIQINYPDDSNEVFGYDKNSNLTSKKKRDGNSVNYEYDALNRMTVKNGPVDPNIYFSYGIASRIAEVNDLRTVANGGGLTRYYYDRIGRVEDINDPQARWVSYEYDELSGRTKLVYPDDSNVTYQYDAMSRLDKIFYNGAEIADYDYDELSRRILVTLGNDANAVYEYDLGNRLTKLTNNIDDGNSITFEYDSYDNVGNRLSMAIDSNEDNYSYDEIYRLVLVDYNDGNSTAYTYDSLGNRTDVNDGTSAAYVSNNLNQYTSVGGTSYLYNSNGNLTDDGTYLYYYDCENRLTDINDKDTGDPKGSYEYDYRSRRISSTVDGNTTEYCYDGDQVIAEYDGSGIVRKFIYGPGIDEPICMIDVTDGNAVYYYHFDGLGSVVALSDINNDIIESYSYDVFGQPSAASGIGNPYLFTGRRYDPEAGLYYYRARYYDYSTGRFIQPDPIGYKAGLNLYAYCGNNPISSLDPWGLAPNQAGVTNPSHVLQSLKNNSDLSNLRDIHGGNIDRYFYTEEYGWVDIRHFAESARRAKESPSWWVETLGFGNEVKQWLFEWGDDYRSGFSPEDLTSNSAGANFGSTYLRQLPADKAFEKWMKAAKARKLDDITAMVQALPLTDPSVKGGKNRGSSNISSEAKKQCK